MRHKNNNINIIKKYKSKSKYKYIQKMKTLNLLFFAFLISLMHNFYSQYNTIFLQSFTFLFLF